MQHYDQVSESLRPNDEVGRLALTEMVELAIQRDQEATIAEEKLVVAQQEVEVLRKDAYTHHLTGLPNRKALNLQSTPQLEHIELPERRQLPIAGWMGIFVDLDHFKKVNDEFGHAQGDRLLRFAGVALQRTIRQIDELYHLSGDEFMLFLPAWTRRPPQQVALEHKDRFQRFIRKQAVGNLDLMPADMELTTIDRLSLIKIGATFGAHWSEGTYLDRVSLLDTAETAMREAKKHNSNR